jgi:hypothetical protein
MPDAPHFVRALSAARHRRDPPPPQNQRSVTWRTDLTLHSPTQAHRRNETYSSQIVLEIEGWVMTKFQYLQEQAARAERLARSILDAVTAERLQAFAAECRAKAKTLDEPRSKAA